MVRKAVTQRDISTTALRDPQLPPHDGDSMLAWGHAESNRAPEREQSDVSFKLQRMEMSAGRPEILGVISVGNHEPKACHAIGSPDDESDDSKLPGVTHARRRGQSGRRGCSTTG